MDHHAILCFSLNLFRKLVGGIERWQHGTGPTGKHYHHLRTALGAHPEPQHTGPGLCQSNHTGHCHGSGERRGGIGEFCGQPGNLWTEQQQWTISHDVFGGGELGGLFDFMPNAYFLNVDSVDVRTVRCKMNYLYVQCPCYLTVFWNIWWCCLHKLYERYFTNVSTMPVENVYH